MTGRVWFTQQGGCSSLRNASGTCSAGYGRRVRHVSRLYMMPQSLLYIPQLDRTRVPIQLKTNSEPEKKLGIYTCWTGIFSYHVAQLLTTRSEYVEMLDVRSWPEMLQWVHGINYSPTLFMGLLQSLTRRRNWRKHFDPSGTNCYPPFVLTGT